MYCFTEEERLSPLPDFKYNDKPGNQIPTSINNEEGEPHLK